MNFTSQWGKTNLFTAAGEKDTKRSRGKTCRAQSKKESLKEV